LTACELSVKGGRWEAERGHRGGKSASYIWSVSCGEGYIAFTSRMKSGRGICIGLVVF